MDVFQKVKWFSAILGIFLVILATNLLDKNNFLRVEESVENIYNERLLAKELLLDVSIKFHKKELAYILNDSTYLQSQNDAVNAEINKLLQMFDRAGATRQEKIILNELNKNHRKLIELEAKSESKNKLYTTNCADIFSDINTNIIELSTEQIKEGNNQKSYAKSALDTVILFSNIEIYMLILLALVLMGIILYSPKNKTNKS